jgi:hypothetical protein
VKPDPDGAGAALVAAGSLDGGLLAGGFDGDATMLVVGAGGLSVGLMAGARNAVRCAGAIATACGRFLHTPVASD